VDKATARWASMSGAGSRLKAASGILQRLVRRLSPQRHRHGYPRLLLLSGAMKALGQRCKRLAVAPQSRKCAALLWALQRALVEAPARGRCCPAPLGGVSARSGISAVAMRIRIFGSRRKTSRRRQARPRGELRSKNASALPSIIYSTFGTRTSTRSKSASAS
jgi:hypothetical protein